MPAWVDQVVPGRIKAPNPVLVTGLATASGAATGLAPALLHRSLPLLQSTAVGTALGLAGGRCGCPGSTRVISVGFVSQVDV